ncbi:NAD(P)H-dependent flavin oxidoreductase [Lentibacillus cibarius]|uniref:NAD(P)H-dependent flavin oxidoreductase n=1 Tax=Lentibacillus cibarius TaxID=2583219 RepID=UPI002278CB44|nr:nitronate monooxygenase [Lentibacillus cibarius]
MQSFLELAGVDLPIIQAGMAGGITTPELVAAVADEGALGTIGAGYMTEDALREDIRRVKQLTEKPFAVNLFATDLEVVSGDEQPMQPFLDGYRGELGMPLGDKVIQVHDYLEEKINVIVKEDIPIVSTAFGVLADRLIKLLKKHDVILIGMATSVDEARQLESAGYDVVVAQGSEAGGHRSTFDVTKHPDGYNIGLLVLLQEMLDAIDVPVVAAGGIHTKIRSMHC